MAALLETLRPAPPQACVTCLSCWGGGRGGAPGSPRPGAGCPAGPCQERRLCFPRPCRPPVFRGLRGSCSSTAARTPTSPWTVRPELGLRGRESALNPSIRPGECRAERIFTLCQSWRPWMERLGLGGAAEPHDGHSDDSPLGKGQGPCPLPPPQQRQRWVDVSPCARVPERGGGPWTASGPEHQICHPTPAVPECSRHHGCTECLSRLG